ncbi:hypothetical protein SH139x_000038 [Planctomycetaceae bacterium SH139]
MQIDLKGFAKSKIGGLLIQAGTQLAAAEMDKDPNEAMSAVIEALGFDPLGQDARLAIDVLDIENPLNGLTAVLSLKNSTGNLEGLLLAVPGYKSLTHEDRVIHSLSPDGRASYFIAFANSPTGEKQIVAAASLEDLLEKLRTQSGESVALPAGQFANIQLHSPPQEMIEETPLAALVDLLEATSVSIGEEGNHLVVRISLTANDEEKANQLQQLAQGVIAMVSLFKEEISQELDDEETAKQVLSVIKQIKIQREGANVTVETRVPEQTIINFLREEAELPL